MSSQARMNVEGRVRVRALRTADEDLRKARQVLSVEVRAIAAAGERLDIGFVEAVDAIADCTGKVLVTGVGKSGVVARKLAATLTLTGAPSMFFHPTEALHGSLGVARADDVLVSISNSGETHEVLAVQHALAKRSVVTIAIVGPSESQLATEATIVVAIGVPTEAGPLGLVPSASTTAAMAVCDALAFGVAERRGLRIDELREAHPAGAIGRVLDVVGGEHE